MLVIMSEGFWEKKSTRIRTELEVDNNELNLDQFPANFTAAMKCIRCTTTATQIGPAVCPILSCYRDDPFPAVYGCLAPVAMASLVGFVMWGNEDSVFRPYSRRE